MNTHEDFVSLETAMKLKEKGFNWPCFAYYSEYADDWNRLKFWSGRRNTPRTYDTVRNSSYVLVPTHQTIIKWLWENFSLRIVPNPVMLHKDQKTGFLHKVGFYADTYDTGDFMQELSAFKLVASTSYCDTPEEAIESAIDYALDKLVDKKQNG